LVRTCLWSHF